MKRHFLLYLRSMMVLVALFLPDLLVGCQTGVSSPSASPTATITKTATLVFKETRTPTPYPPGSPENPLILGLVSPSPDKVSVDSANQLAKKLADFSGYTIFQHIYPTYPDLLEMMQQGRVHIAFLPPLTYILANEKGIAEVGLLTNHYGVYQYGLQFLANKNSNFTPYYDPVTGLSTAGADQALQQFAGKRPCFVEPTSPSGFIIPTGLLIQNRIPFLDPVITQSHIAVIRALYIRDICDFGVTFAISGDPRTSSALNDLPDVKNQVPIVWLSDPMVPSTNLSFVPDLRDDIRQNMTTVFQDLVHTEDGKQLLSKATNYDIQDMKPIADEVYDPLRLTIFYASVDLETLVGK